MDILSLKTRLEYNPNTGSFIWKYNPNKSKQWNTRYARTRAGSITITAGKAYIKIRFDGSNYYAHIIAWLHMTGNMPIEQIDHKDGDGTNNKWSNLREATRSQNFANSYKVDRGVFPNHGKYQARIQVNHRRIFLGTFYTKSEAQAAYDAAANKYFGEYARINR